MFDSQLSPRRCIFTYRKNGLRGFWILQDKKYHHFILVKNGSYYIRSTSFLPSEARGECVNMLPKFVEIITQLARARGVELDWFDDAGMCELAEMEKETPHHVYGLADPAGYFLADSTAKNHNSDGDSTY